MKTNDAQSSWNKFLNPTVLKSNLIKASVYIVFFELLTNTIIDKVKDFYICGFEDGKDIYSKEYITRFKKDGVSVLDESLNWFVEHKAISPEDKKKVIELKNHRNEIAHEMLSFIASTEKEVKEDLLVSCYEILAKIDKWWIIEVELPTNPETMQMDPASIDYDGIQSMSMIVLQLLAKVYTGNDEELKTIYEKFIKGTSI